MNPFADATDDDLRSGRLGWLDDDQVAALAANPLDGIDTEYPHHAGAVDGPDDPPPPSTQHPVFYGCYDWHSAVHSHWSLVRAVRLIDDHPSEAALVESVEGRLTPEAVAAELEYLAANPGFEKPYGWAWLLRLAAELALWDDPRADAWAETLAPLEATVVDLVETEFLPQPRPFRVGTHGNTAYALSAVHDYARVVGAADLAERVEETARSFFAGDTDYPARYEPLGWDFLSPTLTEACLLARVMAREAFVEWVEDFLPVASPDAARELFSPETRESTERVATHTIGLNLSRAQGLADLADVLGGHPVADPFGDAALAHARAGLAEAFTDEYAGSHWLSSFALAFLTRREDGWGAGLD